MKRLKFMSNLVPLILSGEKTSTWRLFDEKNLTIGDELELLETGSELVFARAKITKVEQKKLGDLTDTDFQGHEKFANTEVMYKTYEQYYKQPVGPQTVIKMVDFILLKP